MARQNTKSKLATSNNHSTAETSPLLGQDRQSSISEVTVGSEVYTLLRIAAPISCGYLLQNSLQLASIMIIGQLGDLELSIAASGYMIATCSAWLLAVGGTTALDALGSKAFTGNADDLTRVGVLLQKCLLVMSTMYVPVGLVWYFIGPFLVYCGQSHELAYGTQTFLRTLAPFGLGYVYFESFKKFLQCQNIQTPGTFILCVSALFNVPVSWTVVHIWKFGLIGGVIATGSMYWIACLVILGYIYFIDGSQAWTSPSKEIFHDLLPFMKLVVLGLIHVGAEWWAFELIAVAAGAMGKVSIAAQSILMTVDSVLALIPFGLGVASTNRIGNLIGLDQRENARLAARAASFIAFTNGCLTMILILTLRRQLSSCFSNDTDVIALAVAVFPWAAGFQVADSLQAANSGSLRAIGRADIGATVNLVAYYGVAIPLGLYTGFHLGWGLHGLWFALAAALSIVGIGEFAVVNLVPWDLYVDFVSAKNDLAEEAAV